MQQQPQQYQQQPQQFQQQPQQYQQQQQQFQQQPQQFQQQQQFQPQYAQPPQQIVVVLQQPSGPPKNPDWKFGLFSCFEDVGTCVKVWLCAPLVISSTKAAIDGSSCCMNCICFSNCCIMCRVRTSARMRYLSSGEDFLTDWATAILCPCCSMIQVQREHQYQMELQRNGPVQQTM